MPSDTSAEAQESEILSDVASEAAEALGVDPAVQSCLDLVAEMKYGDAIPVCTGAVQQFPESMDAKAALEKAQQGASGAAQQAASEAASDAAEAASDAAGKLLEGARD